MLCGLPCAAPHQTGVTVAWHSQPSSARRPAQVFFIRDGIQFVDLVHALRPNPKTNIQEGWRILDFLSHHPESVHIVRRPSHLHPMHAVLEPCHDFACLLLHPRRGLSMHTWRWCQFPLCCAPSRGAM